MIGNEEAILGALLHELQTLGPTRDDAVQRERGGLAALNAAVEERAIDEHSLVVAFHLVGGFWFSAVALAQHLVLQAAGQRHHTVFLAVFSQIFLTLFFLGLVPFSRRGTLFFLLLLEKFLHNHLGLLRIKLRLSASHHVLDGLCEVVDIESFGSHVAQLASDAQS